MFWFFIDEERNGWMKICSNEIVCSLGWTRAALSACLCFFGFSLQPSAGTQRHGHYHIQNSSSHKHHKYSQWKKMPFLFSLTICGSTLPGFSFWRESSFPFWGVFFLLLALPLEGTDIAMHPETSQSKVWYPYILRSCGVHYKKQFFCLA